MTTTPINRVIQHLLATCGRDGMTDGELLTRFLNHQDAAALAALVQRHGPMVWGVCRRLLHNHHDAEDAFQATFLVLVKKAATLPNPETVGNWLYGVAHQTAVRMRATVAKRGVRERQVVDMPEPATAEQYVWNDLAPVVDEELSRVPDKYRVLIVLCDLEGVTRKEVARRLDIPEGTAASRLATARAMLAKRLARRGVVMSGVLLGATLFQQSASAGVPALVVSNTIKVATLMAAGRAAGVISVKAAALTEGVLKAMFLTKLKGLLAVVLVALACLGGGVAVTPVVMGQQPDTPKKSEDKKDAVADAKSELAKLQGVWTVASYEVEGEKLPGKDSRSAMTIIGDKWVMMWVEDDENVKSECGILKITDPEKSPLAVDFVHLDGQHKGSTVFATVKVDGDSLKFCYRDRAEDRPTEFKTKAGDTNCGLVTFNRQKK